MDTSSHPENVAAELILEQVEAYCASAPDSIRYHIDRIRSDAQDAFTRREIAEGWADESDLADASLRLRDVCLYLENQGDKFHPYSDELLAITGPANTSYLNDKHQEASH